MSGSATIVSDRSDIGVGVSQQFTDLSMGENTLTLVKGSNVTSGAATLEILGNAVLTGNAVFDTQDGTELIIGGDVTGDYGLTKNGTGILTLAGLTGTNSYTGNTIINGGELHLTGQSSFASQTQVTIATGAFLRIGPNASVSNVVINSRPDGLLIEGTAQLDTVLNADGQLSQDLAKVQGSHTISENVVVSADDDYFGSAPGNATDDRIILESNATIRATKAFSMNANKGIRIASGLATFDTQENLELPNQIKGNGGLVKNGNAKLVIRGLNTYQGNTQVKQGRLEIATGGSLDASSAVTVDTGAEIIINGTIGGSLLVSSGATLSGSGTIEGSTTISGAHTPGNSPGIQTFASDLTYASGSTVTWELGGNTNQNSPVIYDQLVVNGNLNFSGATTMNLSFKFLNSAVDWNNGFWDSNQSWVVYDVTGSTTNFGNLSLNQQNWLDSNSIALNSARSNAFFTLTLSGNDILLNYTAVPETSVTLLGGLSALLMLRRRRAA
jgi:autotransporter-associated beta strand protein